MGGRMKVISESQRTLRWSILMGAAIPILSLMVGIFTQTVFYEIAHNIPPVIRQDAHISLPLCRMIPDLYGCDPWVGALSSMQIWELSQHVGQISGLLINLILVAIVSILITVWSGVENPLPAFLLGIVALLFSLAAALIFDVPINIDSPLGVFGILTISLLLLSGWMGGWIGKKKLGMQMSRRSMRFLPGDEAGKLDWFGESLSSRELEVLALVAEGFKNQEIAQRLFISQATVKTHLIHIFSKLGVESRTAAVTKALACGLLRQDEGEIEFEVNRDL